MSNIYDAQRVLQYSPGLALVHQEAPEMQTGTRILPPQILTLKQIRNGAPQTQFTGKAKSLFACDNTSGAARDAEGDMIAKAVRLLENTFEKGGRSNGVGVQIYCFPNGIPYLLAHLLISFLQYLENTLRLLK